ncbi:hypothetical protein DACRYDRAFT_20247 [Dacryopinax primogenitus]|uniref:Uncharacterized protein n=1 Tax=Dacryopinax primogenitus (strain DJM 731) TaxID=1858805 RepID=M5GDH5_DACPD|nr:uncharacterized protein DACRYDRAFT_20247 [Dacryopinax primogenitus]EJU04537.1 hypothetical protein DACRYDRAFT_20247 [Dacryopinax primogenitus]
MMRSGGDIVVEVHPSASLNVENMEKLDYLAPTVLLTSRYLALIPGLCDQSVRHRR